MWGTWHGWGGMQWGEFMKNIPTNNGEGGWTVSTDLLKEISEITEQSGWDTNWESTEAVVIALEKLGYVRFEK